MRLSQARLNLSFPLRSFCHRCEGLHSTDSEGIGQKKSKVLGLFSIFFNYEIQYLLFTWPSKHVKTDSTLSQWRLHEAQKQRRGEANDRVAGPA